MQHPGPAASDRQILSVVTGDAHTTAAFRDHCADRGVFGAVFCPPATPAGRNYVRFTMHCGIGEAECARFLDVMESAKPILSARAKSAHTAEACTLAQRGVRF